MVRHAEAVSGLVEGVLELAADGPRTLLRSTLPGNKHWNERLVSKNKDKVPPGRGQQLLALAVGRVQGRRELRSEAGRWLRLVRDAGRSEDATRHHRRKL